MTPSLFKWLVIIMSHEWVVGSRGHAGPQCPEAWCRSRPGVANPQGAARLSCPEQMSLAWGVEQLCRPAPGQSVSVDKQRGPDSHWEPPPLEGHCGGSRGRAWVLP